MWFAQWMNQDVALLSDEVTDHGLYFVQVAGHEGFLLAR
jgi:hypothetical protein